MVEEAVFLKSNNTINLKIALAKILYSKNIDQLQISKILNLSQPMVSNYCKSDEKIPKNLLDLAEEISNKIINGSPLNLHTCILFSEKNLEGKFHIAKKTEIISNEKNQIIDNMTKAFLLLKDKNINRLIPKVKVNIAMTNDKAENSEDVAAFLNGLIIVDEKVTSYNGIGFGKSKHLSSLLLSLRNLININAIMNVAYIENPAKTSLSYGYLTKNFKFEDNKKNVDILLHKGDFGIEPCSYILGTDAIDVVSKILKLMEEL